MTILEKFTHAESYELLSMGDKLLATGYIIILGMLITFAALVLIMFLTTVMSKTIQIIENKQKPQAPTVPKKTVTEAPVIKVEKDEDDDLIAVISAAVAASLNTSIHNIVVSNIVRVSDSTPVWGQSGRREVMSARVK